jgi:hypothetical protein
VVIFCQDHAAHTIDLPSLPESDYCVNP